MTETDQPRTFVSFSSTDLKYYRTMMMWNANEGIDLNFEDYQLDDPVNSTNPYYINSVLRRKIRRVDTFILLIGDDTWQKTIFVKSEVEVAIEKGCRLIGMNLNNGRSKDWLCPDFFAEKGALFVPFSSRIAAEALKPWRRDPLQPGQTNDWYFYDHVYTALGYDLVGDTAVIPKKPNPWAR